jgi:hypothetical protein
MDARLKIHCRWLQPTVICKIKRALAKTKLTDEPEWHLFNHPIQMGIPPIHMDQLTGGMA